MLAQQICNFPPNIHRRGVGGWRRPPAKNVLAALTPHTVQERLPRIGAQQTGMVVAGRIGQWRAGCQH